MRFKCAWRLGLFTAVACSEWRSQTNPCPPASHFVNREFRHMTRGIKDKMTRKKAKAWPKPHRTGSIPTKTRIETSLCSLVENRALFVFLEWTSTVTRCEIGRVQCKHTINHSEVNSTSIAKSQKQSVYLMGSCDLLIFKRDALSLSIKTCARTRRVKRQTFVTKIRGTPKWKPYWLHVKK